MPEEQTTVPDEIKKNSLPPEAYHPDATKNTKVHLPGFDAFSKLVRFAQYRLQRPSVPTETYAIKMDRANKGSRRK